MQFCNVPGGREPERLWTSLTGYQNTSPVCIVFKENDFNQIIIVPIDLKMRNDDEEKYNYSRSKRQKCIKEWLGKKAIDKW